MVGRGKAEAVIKMLQKYPLYNEYWEDKRAKLEKINVPAYVLASYSSSLHTSGSIAGFNEISSKEKWYVSSSNSLSAAPAKLFPQASNSSYTGMV